MFVREKLITRTYSEAFFMFLRMICQHLACNMEIILTSPGPGYFSFFAETRQNRSKLEIQHSLPELI
jgi:hypothetical protein